MKRKLQVMITEDNWTTIETLLKEANENFKLGSINYSDIINEMALNAKIDLKTLQAKHANIRKSLRSMACEKDIDIETAIKMLTELKNKSGRKHAKAVAPSSEDL
jgi:hypothetical protein